MKLLSITLACLVLTGCASRGPSNYQLYAETQAKIAQANAVAETARYNALADIAKNGDSAAKVAAVLSIQLANNGGSSGQRNQQTIAAPEDWDQKLLRWAGVIVPAAMQGLAIGAQIHAANMQKQIAVTQSNNAAATAQNTNNTFAAMSTNMATSNTNIAKAGFDAVGAAGTALTNVATAGLTATQNTATAGITGIQNVSTAGISQVGSTALAGFNNSTILGTAGINGVNAATTTSVTGINTAIASGNTLTNNVATGYTTALQASIAKLTGTTTTTTTNTTNTTTTSTNNNVCPVGQIFTGGQCQ